MRWISSPDSDSYSVSSVSWTGKLCSWTLIHGTSLQESAEKCYRVSLNFFPVFCPSWQMMEHMPYSVRWWSSECESSRVKRRKEGESERVRDLSHICRPERLLTYDIVLCVPRCACVCVSVSVCVWTQHVPTKLVYHQLCSGSRSVPASVQYFFQFPPPNGGSGRFYCATLGRLLWPDPEHLALCGLNVLWLWT